MKPITNILLVVALACYVFLPFYDITFQGDLKGLDFTAGVITRTESLRGTIFALIPFIAGFLAVGLNCLKNRNWSYGSVGLILAWLWFFYTASDFQEFALIHAPEVTPTDDLGEGFAIESLGSGFISSCVLTGLALISGILSLLPFKFNEAIERAVDDTIDKSLEGSRKHIKAWGDEVRGEWNKLEAKAKKRGKPDGASTEQPEQHTAEPPMNKEDDSRFMPQQPSEAQPAQQQDNAGGMARDDHSRFMPGNQE